MINENTPLVSVLIPYYNDEDYLIYSIQSILNQTYKNFELILINHASTDNSRNIAHSFHDNRIVHIDLPENAGAGGGVIFNAFINKARGEFCKLFCADDYLYETFLETSIGFFNKNPQIDILFSDMSFIDDKGEKTGENWFHYRNFKPEIRNENDILYQFFHRFSVLPLPASIFRQKVCKNIEIDYTLMTEFDVLLWIRLIANGGKIGFIKESLCNYRIHSKQTSSSSKIKINFTRTLFEHEIILDEFFKIMNPNLLERIISPIKINYQHFIQPEYSTFICRFIFSEFLLYVNNYEYQRKGYYYIHLLFQDKEKRDLLNDIFNFKIRDFREMYSSVKIENNNDLLMWFFSNGRRNLNKVGTLGLIREVIRRCVRKVFPKKNKLVPL